jgi:hypothetical protein
MGTVREGESPVRSLLAGDDEAHAIAPRLRNGALVYFEMGFVPVTDRAI